MYRFQSLIRLVFSDKEISNRLQRDFLEKKNNRNIKKLRSFLLKKHIYYPTSGIIFISTETSFSDLKKILDNYFVQNNFPFSRGENKGF